MPIGFFVLDRHAHWLVALIGVPAGGGAPWRGRQEIDRHAPALGGRLRLRHRHRLRGPVHHAVHRLALVLRRRAPTGSLGRLVLLAAISIVGLLGAMLWALKTDNTAALWLAYAGFAIEVFILHVMTIGTLLNTSLFFLVSALIVSAFAYAAYRLHQRKAVTPGVARMIPFLKNRIVLTLVIVALAQTGVLAGMVVDRVRLLKTGREITLPIVPVDPRDFFRGQYVRLGYDISRVPARLLEGPLPDANAAFYVTLERKPDGAWVPIKLSRTRGGGKLARSHRAEGARASSAGCTRTRATPTPCTWCGTASRATSCPRARARGWRRSRATRSSPPASPSTAAATPPSRAC